ncbi:MAG TPA: fluoride efflux transporter CrcB [Actinocrinis sp.]|nr:fluoride efflux transporter CrcB [Actinocrinis sp.]
MALVGLGASFGAVARYLVDRAVTRRRGTAPVPAAPFPGGTWLINVSGAFVLGLLVGLAGRHGMPADVLAVVGTGVCGGYTTFSTFSVETIRLAEDGRATLALVNMVSSIAFGLAAAALGLGLAYAV